MSCPNCDGYARRIAQLEEELKESEEDRRFVKTLWRQVQAEHGDIGDIVNTVLDRVARQSQDKDRDVLQMLQDKDTEIAELKNEVTLFTPFTVVIGHQYFIIYVKLILIHFFIFTG